MSKFSPPATRYLSRIVAGCLLFAAGYIGTYLVRDQQYKEDADRERVRQGVRVQAQTVVREEFARLRFVQPPPESAAEDEGEMLTRLVYEGSSSEILLTTAPSSAFPLMATPSGRRLAVVPANPNIFKITALGRTAKHRYFEVEYTFDSESIPWLACKTPSRCVQMTNFRELTVPAAKRWVFDEKDADQAEYQRIFGEPMPARTAPA